MEGLSKDQSRNDPDRADSDEKGDERFGYPIDPHRAFRCLMAGKLWLAGALVLGAAVSLPTALFLVKRSYTATAMLKYEGVPTIAALPSEEQPNVGGMLQSIYVEDVLAKIKERAQRDESLPVLGQLIQVEADPAQVVRIRAPATDPGEAARFANATMHVFLEHQIDVQRQRIQAGLDGVSERAAAATRSLREAQTAYDSFREEHGIADLSTEQEQAIEAAAELRAGRDSAENDIRALEARIEQLRRELRQTPRTLTQSVAVATTDQAELQRAQGELTQARANLSEDHPRVMALKSQVATLDERVRGAGAQRKNVSSQNAQYGSLQAALSTAQADLEASRQRLEGLTQRAAEAQRRVEQFSSIEGDASQLLARVRINERLVADLEGQKAQLEDAARNPGHGFRVMSEATAPAYAEPSKKKYFVAIGVPLGLLVLTALLLLVRELRGLRVSTASEVAFWGRGPVIGASAWPRVPQSIDDLIADLDDFVPDAKGKMLVVGANERSQALAQQFAARLNSDWFDTTLLGSVPPGPMDPGPSIYDEPAEPKTGSKAIVAYRPQPIADRSHHVDVEVPMRLQVECWDGPLLGPQLRRAARLADRVCVLVAAGETTGLELAKTATRLGRSRGVGYLLVNVEAPYAELLDRVGPVDEFWSSVRD